MPSLLVKNCWRVSNAVGSKSTVKAAHGADARQFDLAHQLAVAVDDPDLAAGIGQIFSDQLVVDHADADQGLRVFGDLSQRAMLSRGIGDFREVRR